MTEVAVQSHTANRRRPWLITIVIIVLLGGAAFFFDHFKYDFFPKRFGVVVPGEIYRSGQLSPRQLKPTLQSHNIKTVIDFQGEKDQDPAMDNETQVCEDLGIDHRRFPLAGNGTGKIENYADALALIVQSQRDHKPILIHCSAGTQRTGAATAFFRLLIEHQSPQEAHKELAKFDWDPKHDAILVDYMNSHMRELADLLVQRHVIEKVPDPLPTFPKEQ
jgi:protein tyrosine phosphatase (PTP) superfamily phosphohydrolase (DUF442 family)